MPNFFASPSGSDSAAGTSASPFRTITRAVAAAVAAGGSGTIRAANGLYDAAAGETFPISIPPGYMLAGEARNTTVVQFETPASGMGIAAIESGSGVRELTLRAGRPLPGGGATCTHGIFVNTSDAVIQRVRVLPSSDPTAPFPFPPAPWPTDIGLFDSAISSTESPRARIDRCVVEWHLSWVGRDATVDACVFRDAGLFIDRGLVTNCSFVGRGVDFSWPMRLWCAVDDRLTVRGNNFSGSASLEIDAFNLPVRGGAGPLIVSNVFDRCWSAIGTQGTGATGRVRNNTIRNIVGYGVSVGYGSPEFSDNSFHASAPVQHDLVRVSFQATRPVFQRNTFDVPLAPPPLPTTSIQIRSAADFGGGGSSVGGNDFSRIGGIYCAAPGEEIFLQSNIWRTVPADQIGVYTGTTVHL